MNATHTSVRGSCFCGSVTIEVPAPPRRPVVCHCGQCRRLSGAAFTTWVTAARAHTRIEGREHLTSFQATTNVLRCFCRRCGSHVYTEDARLPNDFGMPAGVFEGSALEPPTREYFVDDRPSWSAVHKHE